MRIHIQQTTQGADQDFQARGARAFTLAEVVISVALAGLIFSGILTGYVHAAKRAEWSGYNLAAGATSVQQIEQARAAVWDTDTGNNVLKIALINRSTNVSGTKITIKGHSREILDIPYAGGASSYLWVTNYVTIVQTNVLGRPSIPLQFLRVDAVWKFKGGFGGNRNHTNTMVTMLAADDRMLGN